MARFEEVGANLGVDSARFGSEWMMVPHRGSNFVRFSDGDGFDVAAADRRGLRIADVTKAFTADLAPPLRLLATLLVPRSRVFRVTGLLPGVTKIIARRGGATASIVVTVVPKHTFSIACYFLQNRAADGSVTPRTSFTPPVAHSWVEDLNKVFGPQANIWFTLARSEFLPLADLGEWFGSEDDVARLAKVREASGAQVTIFLAGPKIWVEKSEPRGFYHVKTKVIIMQDQFVKDVWAGPPAPMLKTMAHEIAHFLNHARSHGQGHDHYETSGYKSDIMHTDDGSNIKISRERVRDWNPV